MLGVGNCREAVSWCAHEGDLSAWCKVHVGVSHNAVAKGNCVAVRRGGEQPEANCRSAG